MTNDLRQRALSQTMPLFRILYFVLIVSLFTDSGRADVFRWDNGALIPGTEGVIPGPSAQFDNMSLHYAELRNADLTNASFTSADLTKARFLNTKLAGANFSDAFIDGTVFSNVVALGFSAGQLYSTASYKSGSLAGLALPNNDLTGWDFQGQDLQRASASSSKLNGASFSHANMERSYFAQSKAIGTNFENANLTAAGLHESDYSSANFRNATLVNATLGRSNLSDADFTGANIAGAELSTTNLTKAQLYSTSSYAAKDLRRVRFHEVDLTDANFVGQDLTSTGFWNATLANASFDDAIVQKATLWNVTARGFTAAQLYATKSYQDRDLRSLTLSENNLTSWDLSHQNLDSVFFWKSNLTDVDFSGSSIADASFEGTNLTNEQLYSTTTYQSGDLHHINFAATDLQEAQFDSMDLSRAKFNGAKLAGADFTDANIEGTSFGQTTQFGLTSEQIYSTATYRAGHLRGVSLIQNDLRNWGFQGLDLSGAYLSGSRFAGADFADAVVNQTSFQFSVQGGFSREMLESTASFQNRDLRGIDLGVNDLTGWSFRDQDLSGASFYFATLTGADFTNAIITGTSFRSTVSKGFTKEQLYSTASYVSHDLRGVNLERATLDGWDFRYQFLAGADLSLTTVVGADFSKADTRGAYVGNFNMPATTEFEGANIDDMILPDGSLLGLQLFDGELLRIRDYDPISGSSTSPPRITAYNLVQIEDGAVLRLEFEADDWNSTIAFNPGIDVGIAGTLELVFATGVDVLSQVGREIQVFDWTGVSPIGQFSVVSQYAWELENLYTTGVIRLRLPGDANNDDVVNVQDLNLVRNHFGESGPNVVGDSNGDHRVDVTDLNNVRNYFGASAPASNAVPEPATWTLTLAGVIAAGVMRRLPQTRLRAV